MNTNEFNENLMAQAAYRLNEAAALSQSADDLYKIREIHKHIHRAQTYLWVLEDSLKLNH
ncbi:hypothetical protein [Corynebacterium aurimucosum]|nr:hypothetical protein [Corynebacterium aurimucosum]NJJ83730.1 hypothetical protein [Corynebacterium aurimucosum]